MSDCSGAKNKKLDNTEIDLFEKFLHGLKLVVSIKHQELAYLMQGKIVLQKLKRKFKL